MTTEKMLALSSDGIDRCLIRGRLRETKPEYYLSHGRILAATVVALEEWRRSQGWLPGMVHFGDVPVQLRRTPDTTVGVDIAVAPNDGIAPTSDGKSALGGTPVAVVKILCPNASFGEIWEDLDCFREAGVPLVWVIDPHDQTVTVYRPDAEPELFNVRQELSGEPHLPGFRVPVARLFS